MNLHGQQCVSAEADPVPNMQADPWPGDQPVGLVPSIELGGVHRDVFNAELNLLLASDAVALHGSSRVVSVRRSLKRLHSSELDSWGAIAAFSFVESL